MRKEQETILDVKEPTIADFEETTVSKTKKNKMADTAKVVKEFIPKIEMVPISELKEYANNPRINDQAVEQVKESIKMFGMNVPLTIDKNNVIATGHTRLKALVELGATEVPCIRLDKLTDAEIDAWRVVDNRTAEFAAWDWKKLETELMKIAENEIDLSVFDFEIHSEREKTEDKNLDDFTPEVPIIPKAKKGDIYILGSHRLMCGDSTSKEDLDKLCQGNLADLVVTDPPYNVDYNKNKNGRIENDKMSEEDFYKFLLEVYKQMAGHLKQGGAFYIWYADVGGGVFRTAMAKTEGMLVNETLIWEKNHFTLGRQDYQWQHEPCLYGWKEGESHYFIDSRSESTIQKVRSFDIDRAEPEQMRALLHEIQDNWETTVLHYNKPTANDLHPTMKPVALMGRLISNSSKIGDIVLDQFGGSGSTLIACEKLGRKCRMMELDPKSVDVIINRWEQMTGRKAELEAK